MARREAREEGRWNYVHVHTPHFFHSQYRIVFEVYLSIQSAKGSSKISAFRERRREGKGMREDGKKENRRGGDWLKLLLLPNHDCKMF